MKKAKLIFCIAAFYDIDDPHAFLKDVYEVLDDDGVFVIQMNYLPMMLRNLTFDNIGHEHLCYYSLRTLQRLLQSHELSIFDAELNSVNGGSVRAYIKKGYHHPSEKVERLMETDWVDDWTIQRFSQEAQAIINRVGKELISLKKKGKKIYGYGASTRGLTILQALSPEAVKCISAVAERDPHKYGRVMAGVNIPIVPESEAREQADVFFLLPYSFWDSISEREKPWMETGGEFLIPLPFPKLVKLENTGFGRVLVAEAIGQ